jgi:type IV pilus assembly protein PilB
VSYTTDAAVPAPPVEPAIEPEILASSPVSEDESAPPAVFAAAPPPLPDFGSEGASVTPFSWLKEDGDTPESAALGALPQSLVDPAFAGPTVDAEPLASMTPPPVPQEEELHSPVGLEDAAPPQVGTPWSVFAQPVKQLAESDLVQANPLPQVEQAAPDLVESSDESVPQATETPDLAEKALPDREALEALVLATPSSDSWTPSPSDWSTPLASSSVSEPETPASVAEELAPMRVPVPDVAIPSPQSSGPVWIGDEEEEPPAPAASVVLHPELSFEAALDRLFTQNRTFRWKRVGELLKELGLISEQDLNEALHQQAQTRKPLGTILVEMGLITDRLLLKVLAAQKDVQPWYFDGEMDARLLSMLEPDFCRRAQVLPVALHDDVLTLAMRNPSDVDALDHVSNVTGVRVDAALADEETLAKKIEEAFSRDARSHQAHVDALVQEAIKFAEFRPSTIDESKSLQALEEETRPVTGIVNKIIGDGIKMRASDIHIEPTSKTLQVRYRIDGRLHKVSEVPLELTPMISARVKIMAELDPVEWRIPQDGRIGLTLEGKPVDLRVSVLPSFYGGRIVMRILDRTIGLKKLEDIGFSENNFGIFKTLIKRPYGLFLVTGPTGSGKTTSLYAALNYVKDAETNIITCEDPVEYNIDGISQSQVNSKIGLTFAAQLRSILRQDPDVILVGEIRDQETAETGIRASMTGHLVFSTLHCNDAPSAVPRLLDMGIDPYLLSTSLIGVMGQRLLRRICKDCRMEYDLNDEEKTILERTFNIHGVDKLWKGHGCLNCGGTGYKGRFAVHEIMPVTHEIASVIAGRKATEQIAEVARHYGYKTMQEDATARVLRGETTLKESQRLLAFDDIPRVDPNQSILGG